MNKQIKLNYLILIDSAWSSESKNCHCTTLGPIRVIGKKVKEGMGDISILASQEKHFIKIYENLSQYPRILHQFVKSGTKGLGGNIICEYIN